MNSNDHNIRPKTLPSRAASDNAHHAGAYGFSRIEVRAFLVVFGLLIVLGVWQWWNSERQVPPSWVIERVAADSIPALSRTGDGQSNSLSRRSASRQRTINLNLATRRELVRLPGIGPELARRIIEDRERNGPFSSLADLQRVNGIGRKKSAALIGWVYCGQADSAVVADSIGSE